MISRLSLCRWGPEAEDWGMEGVSRLAVRVSGSGWDLDWGLGPKPSRNVTEFWSLEMEAGDGLDFGLNGCGLGSEGGLKITRCLPL